MYLGKNVMLALLSGLMLASCEQELVDGQLNTSEAKPVPASIEYNEQGGSLSHLIYRAKFEYNAANQVVSVRDTLLTPQVAPSGNAAPWVNFYYEQGRLAQIVLRSGHYPLKNYNPETDAKASRFHFTYEGDSVRTRRMIAGQEQGTFAFKVDENGFPVRKNVRYGATFLNAAGNIDFVAENNAAKSRNTIGRWEILEQTFDQNQNIFANSKEFQMLGVLLAAYQWDMVTSFVPYLGILTTNNELSKTTRYCSTIEGCRTAYTVLSETSSVNDQKYPTRRLTQVGAMGRHQFIIQYKEN